MPERASIPVETELRQVEDVLMDEISSGTDAIDSIARYCIKNGGKRIRPMLFLLAAKMVGAPRAILPRIGAALEMFHTASLLHDDVVDDAPIRRGKPSAKAKWGNQVSVLVGDLLLCRASKIISDQKNSELMDAVIEAVGQTTEGELVEIAHQNDVTVGRDTYLKIIGGKTAALFGVSARAAAIVANVEENFRGALYKFGLNVGLAFQLADDALDYVADEARFGKSAGTDLREGKLTYPLIVALEHASDSEHGVIRGALLAGEIEAGRFGEVIEIIKHYGGIESTWRLAREYVDQAKSELSAFKPSIERDSLLMLADYAVDRRE